MQTNLEQPVTPSVVLKGALERIRKGWTKEYYARDINGNKVDANSRHAVCWCLLGALMTQSFYTDAGSKAIVFVNRVINKIPSSRQLTLSHYNDRVDTTQEDVIKVLEAALVLAEKGDVDVPAVV